MEYYRNPDGSYVGGSMATLLYKLDEIISLLKKYNHGKDKGTQEGSQEGSPQGKEGSPHS